VGAAGAGVAAGAVCGTGDGTGGCGRVCRPPAAAGGASAKYASGTKPMPRVTAERASAHPHSSARAPACPASAPPLPASPVAHSTASPAATPSSASSMAPPSAPSPGVKACAACMGRVRSAAHASSPVPSSRRYVRGATPAASPRRQRHHPDSSWRVTITTSPSFSGRSSGCGRAARGGEYVAM
jgi:hypothetical protein